MKQAVYGAPAGLFSARSRTAGVVIRVKGMQEPESLSHTICSPVLA